MPSPLITPQRIHEHVIRLGEKFPPVPLESVDRTIINPQAVKEKFSAVLSYMARVEMEVERNVLELLILVPDIDETNTLFYRDVWAPQELHHGLILDRLGEDLGMAPVQANLNDIPGRVKVLGALSHLRPIQDIITLLYYLTGAATEKSAMLAYASLHKGLIHMEEHAIAHTIINPIKVQEPGHFGFYKLSAEHLLQSGALSPWQLFLTRVLRSKAFGLVGVNNKSQKADYGQVMIDLGLNADLNSHVRDISRVEKSLLWAQHKGMDVPGYVLQSFQDAISAAQLRVA